MADNIPRFGASDFWLVQTDAAQLREQLRSALETVLGRPVVDADPHMVLASAFLPFFVQGQASADACAKATLRAFAVGQDLDRIADSTCVVGYLDRMPARGAVLAFQLHCTIRRAVLAVPSVCRVSWSASAQVPTDNDVPVPEATDLVTFSGSGEFDIEFLAVDGAIKEIWVPVYLTCEEAGARYNGLCREERSYGPGAIAPTLTGTEVGGASGQTYSFEDVDQLWRCGASYNGADAESDEDFSRRVAWQAKALRVPGSHEYYLLALSELYRLASWAVAPTVDSEGRVQFAWADKASYWEPSGAELTMRGPAYDEFLRIVKGSLMVEQRGYVYEATLDAGTGWFTMYYELPSDMVDVDSARAAVADAWRLYASSVAWKCGAILRRSDMIAAVMRAGASRAWLDPASPQDVTLPLDRFITLDRFTLVYDGLSTDSAAPAGGTGEEVVP